MKNHWLLQRFEQNSEDIAIVEQSGSYRYKILLQQINLYIELLDSKLVSGTKVVILSDYSIDSIALFMACSMIKLIIVPVISQNENEIKERLIASNAQYILTLNNSYVHIKQVDESLKSNNSLCEMIKQRDHSGLILFSSGSTGKPKAMLHDLTELLSIYKNKKTKKLSIIIFLMFDHIGGINTLFNVLSMGAKAIIPADRSPESIARIIEKEQVNILPASPTFLNLLLLSGVVLKYNLSSVRMITYGTEPMPESLLVRVKKTFPRAKLLQTFGTSETGIAQLNSRSSSSLDIKFDDPNLEYKIIEGELWLKSKTQILGYLNASMDNFTRDGWFCTGDLVKECNDGYISIIGRKKEVINVGGEKVLPVEVESQLLSIEGVEDCMVYGQSNAITGQSVSVDVIKNKCQDDKLLKNKIRKECLKKMARFKVPTKINFVDKLTSSHGFKKIRYKG